MKKEIEFYQEKIKLEEEVYKKNSWLLVAAVLFFTATALSAMVFWKKTPVMIVNAIGASIWLNLIMTYKNRLKLSKAELVEMKKQLQEAEYLDQRDLKTLEF